MRPRVYLSGPIYGTTDQEQSWRRQAAKLLGKAYDVLDPMRRDYRNIRYNTVNSRDIIRHDLEEVDHCHVVLANCERPGWGTAMEIFYAHMKGKPVLFFTSNKNPSPWLLAHARNVGTMGNAVRELLKFKKTIVECGLT